jgi:O-antigen chain-terminating methyltransferase
MRFTGPLSTPSAAGHGPRRPLASASIIPLEQAVSLPAVGTVAERLAALLGRPPRILNCGEEPDHLGVHLAHRGAQVDTVALGGLQRAVTERDYDLVLLLGLRDPAGSHDASLRFDVIAERAGALIVDFDTAQPPQSRRERLDAFAFAHELSSSQSGTVFFASNRYWLLGEHAGPIEGFRRESHAATVGAFQGTRRYYFGAGKLAKIFTLDNPHLRAANLSEIRAEAAFLRAPPRGIRAPALIAADERHDACWLVRTLIDGKLLFDMIRDGDPYDVDRILRDVLSELAALEDAGLHHRDVRAWNVIVKPDGHATLIDYGAIGTQPADCGVPRNLVVAFLALAHEAVSRDANRIHGVCRPAFDPDALPAPYRDAVWSMLRTPPDTWRFARLLAMLDEPAVGRGSGAVPKESVQVLLSSAAGCGVQYEERLVPLRSEIDALQSALRRANADLGQREARIATLENEACRLGGALAASTAQLADADVRLTRVTASEAQMREQVATLQGSTSMKITAPLRAARRLLRNAFGAVATRAT